MMRLQGMDPTKFHLAVRKKQLGQQIGNSMSLNVLERLFVRLLPAAGLTGKIEDRWANGKAFEALKATRGKSFKSVVEFGKKKKEEVEAPSTPPRKLKRTASLQAPSTPPRRKLKRTASLQAPSTPPRK